jgi:hypothetical protein
MAKHSDSVLSLVEMEWVVIRHSFQVGETYKMNESFHFCQRFLDLDGPWTQQALGSRPILTLMHDRPWRFETSALP